MNSKSQHVPPLRSEMIKAVQPLPSASGGSILFIYELLMAGGHLGFMI